MEKCISLLNWLAAGANLLSIILIWLGAAEPTRHTLIVYALTALILFVRNALR